MKVFKICKYLLVLFVIGSFFQCELGKKKSNSSEDKKTEQVKPNIIIIYADDLGYGDVGFNNVTTIKTPNLDNLANEGVLFQNAYCNSPMQQTLSKESGLGTFVRRNKDMEKMRSYISSIIDQQDPTYFMFVDDSFMARPLAELEAFCHMYEEFKKLPKK